MMEQKYIYTHIGWGGKKMIRGKIEKIKLGTTSEKNYKGKIEKKLLGTKLWKKLVRGKIERKKMVIGEK